MFFRGRYDRQPTLAIPIAAITLASDSAITLARFRPSRSRTQLHKKNNKRNRTRRNRFRPVSDTQASPFLMIKDSLGISGETASTLAGRQGLGLRERDIPPVRLGLSGRNSEEIPERLRKRSSLSFFSLIFWVLSRKTSKLSRIFCRCRTHKILGKDRENNEITNEIPCFKFTEKSKKPRKGRTGLERFLEFPSRVRLGCPKRYNSRHLRLPEHFQNSLPPSTAGGASFFRSGSGEGLPEPVMEFPAVLGVFLNKVRHLLGIVLPHLPGEIFRASFSQDLVDFSLILFGLWKL